MNLGEKAFDWWRRLVPDDEGTMVSLGHQRAALARLRRAQNPIDVMMEPEALRLIRCFPSHLQDRAAIVAGVLAFVKEYDASHIIHSVGRKDIDKNESVPLSESRFRRLMQLHAGELLDPMRRLVRLNKGRANVYNLAQSILSWGDDWVKKQWILEYYGVERVVEPVGGTTGNVHHPQTSPTGEPK